MSTGTSNFEAGDKVVLIKGRSRVQRDKDSDLASPFWCEELSMDAEYTVERIAQSGGLHLTGNCLVFNCNFFRKVTPPRCFKKHDIVQVVESGTCDPCIGSYGTVTEDAASGFNVTAYYPSLGCTWMMLAEEVEVVS